MLLASFPSPGRSVWDLGPIPLRAYALCIILGIVAAIWIGERRWVERGGRRGTVSDIAVWAVIFGLIGGRLYHVISDNELYFRAGRDPWRAFYVWEGGLGVWGAIALGGVGAWIGCRRRGIKLPPFADACAPGIAVAQGIGRWGNYFNQELFGRPTSLPWGVRIDPDRPSTVPGATAYHPTFLYESLWDLALAAVLIVVDRRFKMGRGRVFALYVMGYTAGRVWIEMLRIDTANHILGLRLNVWTSILVFAGGLIYFLLHPGPRETEVEPRTPVPAGDSGALAGDADSDAADKPATEKDDSTAAGDKVSADDAGTVSTDEADTVSADEAGTVSADEAGTVSADEAGTVSADEAGTVSADKAGTVSADAAGTASGDDADTVSADEAGTASADAAGTASGDAAGTASGDAAGTASGDAAGTVSADATATTDATTDPPGGVTADEPDESDADATADAATTADPPVADAAADEPEETFADATADPPITDAPADVDEPAETPADAKAAGGTAASAGTTAATATSATTPAGNGVPVDESVEGGAATSDSTRRSRAKARRAAAKPRS